MRDAREVVIEAIQNIPHPMTRSAAQADAILSALTEAGIRVERLEGVGLRCVECGALWQTPPPRHASNVIDHAPGCRAVALEPVYRIVSGAPKENENPTMEDDK